MFFLKKNIWFLRLVVLPVACLEAGAIIDYATNDNGSGIMA